ncbi:MAG TPA: PaaI family thioesterase [Nitrososphaerales archaeon]|nr:PaaI family thioesterase [Nitrososphaerales archaeon]
MAGLKEKLRDVSEGKADPPPIMMTLGMKLVQFGDGKATLKMIVDRKYYNPMGTLHGGVMTDLADACMGIATMGTLGEDETFTTLELKMNFIRPVFEDELTAEAKVLHRGRKVVLVESVVKNREGKEVARATATQMVLQSTK